MLFVRGVELMWCLLLWHIAPMMLAYAQNGVIGILLTIFDLCLAPFFREAHSVFNVSEQRGLYGCLSEFAKKGVKKGKVKHIDEAMADNSC